MPKQTFENWILFEDENFILLNKPPLISTLEDRNEPVNVQKMVKNYCSSGTVCHRLDKETSGVLWVAKNPESYKYASQLLEARQVTKVYHAVAEGRHNFQDIAIDEPIAITKRGSVKIDRKRGKSSLTQVSRLDQFKFHTLLDCRPVTGRRHQIRVHLSGSGAPIAGDIAYGGHPVYLSSFKKKFNLKKGTREQPLIKRLALHAYSIEFPTPDGKSTRIEAPYPDDFKVLIKQLSVNR